MNLSVCLGFQAVSMHLIKMASALAVDMLTNPNACFKRCTYAHDCVHTHKMNESMLNFLKEHKSFVLI